jgi:hypothetical protein
MCKRVPFHHKATATPGDLKAWAGMFLDMPQPLQDDHTAEIRREINLANMRREQAGMTTRVKRPDVIPQIDVEIAE